ncbi:hypothetical protein FB567DRAFT_598406 [Paraphoma chrysanthemicola]|uniref:Uncharacterized protein n=1 Tax=Paraphoma chrysanthemicola TaxID=798071 RepID=A0A8K0QUA6_9PLEO|nr:hypothetical protein FB567DRAFT_598406 [Paraphoma chrysanthemicola]
MAPSTRAELGAPSPLVALPNSAESKRRAQNSAPSRTSDPAWGSICWQELCGYGVRLPGSPAKISIETLHKAAKQCQHLLVFAFDIRTQFLEATYVLGDLEKHPQGLRGKAQVEAGIYKFKRQPLLDFISTVDQRVCLETCAGAEAWKATSAEEEFSQLEEASNELESEAEDESLSSGGLNKIAGMQAVEGGLYREGKDSTASTRAE